MNSKVTKNGNDIFEIPDSEVSAAMDKGYYQVVDVSKDGKEFHTIPLAEIKDAEAKGYRRKEAIEVRNQANNRPVSTAEAAVRGGSSGLSLGFNDEVTGGVRALMDPDNIQGGLADRYKVYRDEERARDELAQKQHPVVSTAANIAGSLAVPVPVKGGLLALAAKNAGLGALSGYGNAGEGEGLTGALTGGALGGITGAGGKAVSNLMDKTVAKGLANAAETQAVKATGVTLKDARKAANMGQVNKIGRDLLDEGVVKFGSNVDEIAERAGEKATNVYGKQIEEILDAATDAGGKISPFALAKELHGMPATTRKEILDQMAAQRDPSMKEASFKAAEYLGDLFEKNPNGIESNLANVMKSNLDKDLKWGQRSGTKSDLALDEMRKVRGAMKNKIDESVGEALGPEALAQLNNAQSKYGSLKFAKDAAGDRSSRENLANRAMSLSDYISGAAGLASGNPASAMVMAGGNKLIRTRGNSALAVTLDTVSKALNTVPESLGKFAPVLQAAASKGSLAAVHAALMKSNPEYRQLVEGQ